MYSYPASYKTHVPRSSCSKKITKAEKEQEAKGKSKQGNKKKQNKTKQKKLSQIKFPLNFTNQFE